MVPGFVDGYLHICDHVALWGYPTLNPPPICDVKSIDDIVAKMRRFIDEKKIPPASRTGNYDMKRCSPRNGIQRKKI